VLENRYGDHHIKAAFHSYLKRRTGLIGESPQEFAAATDHLAHHKHAQLYKHLINKEAARAFANGIREQEIRQ
jgi:hypothetical protein